MTCLGAKKDKGRKQFCMCSVFITVMVCVVAFQGYLPPTKNGVEPKRPSRPINITSLVRLSTTVPNTIVVSWTAEIGRTYSMAVYLVKQLSSTVLLQRLRAKGIRNPDHSRALIKEKLTADPDSEIATTSLRVSLLCPLGKMRLAIPCRSLTCSHLQCFDATLYIQMNEKKPTWVCPVCDKRAPYEHLIIDGLFMEILKHCTDCDEIQFKEDGSWAPMRAKKEAQEVNTSFNGVEGCLSSPVDHQVSSHQSTKNRKVEVIDLTVDSSSDEEEEEPSAKRSCPSLSPTSPVNSKSILNLPHQVSPVSRTPSLPAVDTNYINTSLIQDYRHPFHMTPMPYDLQGLDFFSFLPGDNQKQLCLAYLPGSGSSGARKKRERSRVLGVPTIKMHTLSRFPACPGLHGWLEGRPEVPGWFVFWHEQDGVLELQPSRHLHGRKSALLDAAEWISEWTRIGLACRVNFTTSTHEGLKHYSTSLLAAAAAAVSASDDQELLHSRFFPYTSSQMFLDQLNTGGSSALPGTNSSSSGSNSSLVSSNSLRETHSLPVANRSSTDPASLFGVIPDIISLD
ncbi:E3 SUMO-protein ligase PIAS1 [Varanus komodoensis]|nr:E3 SUMO-protein ligase PIAS1 [Varanus komodoensis]